MDEALTECLKLVGLPWRRLLYAAACKAGRDVETNSKSYTGRRRSWDCLPLSGMSHTQCLLAARQRTRFTSDHRTRKVGHIVWHYNVALEERWKCNLFHSYAIWFNLKSDTRFWIATRFTSLIAILYTAFRLILRGIYHIFLVIIYSYRHVFESVNSEWCSRQLHSLQGFKLQMYHNLTGSHTQVGVHSEMYPQSPCKFWKLWVCHKISSEYFFRVLVSESQPQA